MRVLHIIPTLDTRCGGPARALVGFGAALQRAGADVSVIVGRIDPDDPSLIEVLRAAGATVLADGPGVLDERVAWCRVAHFHALWETLVHRAAVRCRRAGRPHVYRPCGMLDPWSLSRSRLKKRLYIALRLRRDIDAASALHFTTETERDLARPLGFRAPVIVEPNGIDRREFAARPPSGAIRRRFGLDDGRPLALFMSRLHPKKGLDLLVPAFAAVPAPATLLIVGPEEAGERARVEAEVAARGLGDRVIIAGVLRGADRLAALADADLLALTSYQENFGVVVLEALAAGTPVLVSDQVNIHREITAAAVGVVVPLRVEAIAEALAAWLGDPVRRADAAGRAAAFAARYDWDGIAARWLEHYARLACPQTGAGAA